MQQVHDAASTQYQENSANSTVTRELSGTSPHTIYNTDKIVEVF